MVRPKRAISSWPWLLATVHLLLGGLRVACVQAQAAEPVRYAMRAPAPETHVVEVVMTIPSRGLPEVEVMMPVWSPGYYRVEDYAEQLLDLAAEREDGRSLHVEVAHPNRWRVTTGGAPRVVVRYRLRCERSFVTGNWVAEDLGVLTGPSTFLRAVQAADGPHEVSFELPPSWPALATGLDPVQESGAHRYRAADYDELADGPFLAGDLEIHEFRVEGVPHLLVDVGERGSWDGERVAEDLRRMVQQSLPLWGRLPYRRYVFLNVFRRGGGGLEHASSSLLTTNAEGVATDEGYRRWLSFAAHEYFHAFNVKRLRPVELGPFDYDAPPMTASLWLAEGVTSYYGDLFLVRAGLLEPDDFLRSVSSAISQLQNAPGRLRQTLEQSSLGVWNNSNSGVAPAESTVSYYVKGQVVGFLLDAEIRRRTDGGRSLDDFMRTASQRYGGERGFTPEDIVRTAGEVSGSDMEEWFLRALRSTEELDYGPALEWYGLTLNPDAGWALQIDPDTSAAQARHFRALTVPAGGR